MMEKKTTSAQQTSSAPIDEMFERIASAIAPYPKAAMFELAERGYSSLFEQLVSCILSIRTYDEVSLPASEALFALATTPEQMASLDEADILDAIKAVTYAERKAPQISQMAARIVEEFEGGIPAEDEVVKGFKGIGPKCANLALGIACGVPRVSVDVHVHRVVNRWGVVETSTPERTLAALDRLIDEDRKVDVNRLLMPFGKHICTSRRPACSTCPVRTWCAQRGVSSTR